MITMDENNLEVSVELLREVGGSENPVRNNKPRRTRARSKRLATTETAVPLENLGLPMGSIPKTKRATKPGSNRKAKRESFAATTTNAVDEQNTAGENVVAVRPIFPSARVKSHGILHAIAKSRAQRIAEAKVENAEQSAPIPTELRLDEPESSQWADIHRGLAAGWRWVLKLMRNGQPKKRLRVCESVSLGEKRFVAVIEVDGEQFLVGGASSSVATLARLQPSQQFSDVLKNQWAQETKRA